MKKMKKMKTKRIIAFGLMLAAGLMAVGCGAKKGGTKDSKAQDTEAKKAETGTELTILAAASLTDVMDEIKKVYEAEHGVKLTFSFAGSGALQTQIEEGAPADVFISASNKQMDALREKDLMKEGTVVNLLENKVVLIVPKDSELTLSSFEDVTKDEVAMIGLGEVESVPAGQYARKIFTYLGIWDKVEKKANFGTDVRTVLGWVEASAVSCGVVYATDAVSSDAVKVVAEAPVGSSDPVIYPAGVVAASSHAKEAEDFVSFLSTDEAMEIFEKYGFIKAGE